MKLCVTPRKSVPYPRLLVTVDALFRSTKKFLLHSPVPASRFGSPEPTPNKLLARVRQKLQARRHPQARGQGETPPVSVARKCRGILLQPVSRCVMSWRSGPRLSVAERPQCPGDQRQTAPPCLKAGQRSTQRPRRSRPHRSEARCDSSRRSGVKWSRTPKACRSAD